MNAISLQPFVTDIDFIPLRDQGYWEQFLVEGRFALRNTSGAQLRDWATGSLATAVEITARRANAIWDLLAAVAKGAWEEFKRAWNALWAGTISAYAKDLCRRVWERLKRLWSDIKNAYSRTASFLSSLRSASEEELAELATAFSGAVIGFIVMGGTGNGGVIDSDIKVLGIGSHRSIWFHSVFAGLAAEVSFRAFFDLQRLLHANLPKQHLPAWDRMLKLSLRFNQGLTGGAWLGVATHLAADSHIDGWTPYKDIPVALPNWGHHLVMDVNAATAGWFGWQWHDKVKRHFRESDFRPASALDDSGHRHPLPLLA